VFTDSPEWIVGHTYKGVAVGLDGDLRTSGALSVPGRERREPRWYSVPLFRDPTGGLNAVVAADDSEVFTAMGSCAEKVLPLLDSHLDQYLMTGKTIRQYRLIEQLGAGGMGVVYKAHDETLDRLVALKFLGSEIGASTQAKARFRLEAKAASRLDSPHICTIHEIGETDSGEMFIVMSFYEGRALKDRISEVRCRRLRL